MKQELIKLDNFEAKRGVNFGKKNWDMLFWNVSVELSAAGWTTGVVMLAEVKISLQLPR